MEKFKRAPLPGDMVSPGKSSFRQPRIEEEETTESGIGTGTMGSGLITPSPNNVLVDVERLEILIGGKRAGNISTEIVNEVVDICQRLFTAYGY